MKLTRRAFLTAAAMGVLAPAYAVGVEPFRLTVRRYQPKPSGWPEGQRLRIVALADLHASKPWMTPARIAEVCRQANELAPDVIVLLGDYVGAPRFAESLPDAEWAAPLGALSAPLGVHAVLGNHDWWADQNAQRIGQGPVAAGLALERAGITVYENAARRMAHAGKPFWLVGLGDQWAFGRGRGVDDLPGALAQADDDAPVILLAHEPDIFPKTPPRVALTLAGHTHGGQLRLFGYAPFTPSAFGDRYAHGHIVERRSDDAHPRHMIVSAGLGCSVLPVRFGAPPEIVVIDLGGAPDA